MAITRDQIFEAADQIVANGGNATLAAVRKALGGGSYTTISEGMAEWKAKRQAVTQTVSEPAPTAIQDRMQEVARELWSAAMEVADTRLRSERENLEQVRQDLERERREAADLADEIAGELDRARSVIAEHEKSAKLAAAQIDRLTGELSDALEQSRVAQAALNESRARIVDLMGALEHEKAAVASAEERANRFEQQEREARKAEQSARLAEQTAQLRLETAERDLSSCKERERKTAKKAEDAVAKLERAAEQVQKRLDTTAAELEASRAETKEAIREAAELRGRLAMFERAAGPADSGADGVLSAADTAPVNH
ncbi:replication region DNA-binding N-term [Methylomagnum ishizawai]|uniref:Replication region DNA-binding N-term n=1 Tax=Methylomagnum ishizawai TaxID=1760988 RepID=A0A1Y6DEM7_9GAMM|nr:DNA-binding protein [Methylomagnum ishizawai]SMF97875.1 replication region DNA-binding N-term [Methylomagnum ishizawai]